MCSVLYFANESEKLRSLLSEKNPFDSVMFIFDGCRRYKVPASSLGITCVSELLMPLGLGHFRSSPFWHYYLYPRCSNFGKGIDGLCGEVIRLTGEELQEESCHVFLDSSLHQVHLLYRYKGEYRMESRRLGSGLYRLKKEERTKAVVLISWSRLNEFLTVPAAGRRGREKEIKK